MFDYYTMIKKTPRTLQNRKLAKQRMETRMDLLFTLGPILFVIAIGLYIYMKVKMSESSCGGKHDKH